MMVAAPAWSAVEARAQLPDPFTEQEQKLSGSDLIGFGWSVALSSDGNTALVGDPGNSEGVGAAWAFTRSGSTWTRQGPKLTGSGEVGAGFFGIDVALSADGNTALVGGSSDDGGVGAAWAFTRSGQTWTQQGPKLTPVDAVGATRFGQSVALSGDGTKALIGAPDDRASPGTTPGVGAAWVFIPSGQTWTQLGPELTRAQESGAGGFGTGVALSADGNTAIVGGQHDDGARGAAWVFVATGPQGQTWSPQGLKLVPEGNSANDASWRLMERVGMRRELHAECDSPHRSGRWLDTVGYAILEEEWAP